MSDLRILIGEEAFVGRLERGKAAAVCAWIGSQLPFTSRLVHARWSGQACWCPIDPALTLPPSGGGIGSPAAGQLLYYAGGLSEPEILAPYGLTRFACDGGQLTGSHFLTVEHGLERLRSVGLEVLVGGAKTLRIERLRAWA
ncbi:MAG: DUF3830 family protein [Pseudomonadota bacterium]|nr:DUF3830 family protein [Pseudomonadota bacterium]